MACASWRRCGGVPRSAHKSRAPGRDPEPILGGGVGVGGGSFMHTPTSKCRDMSMWLSSARPQGWAGVALWASASRNWRPAGHASVT